MEPLVTVVIPNWNGLGHLPECLESLGRQSFDRFRTIVVDNGSSDGSVPWLRENHPGVLVAEMGENTGFARAVNAGIRAAGTPYVALLNNDTAVEPRWLEALVEALEGRRDYDMAASLMVFYDDPGTVNAAGDVFSLRLLTGMNRGRGRPVSEYAAPARVLGACAGAALYRSSLFGEIGLFDERFFLLHEDTDFNLRALLSGRKCIYVPGSVVRHKYHASIDAKPRPEIERLEHRNKFIVVFKDLPAVLWPAVLSVWLWRIFRSTVPLRPSCWSRFPVLWASVPERFADEREAFRLGREGRHSAWRLRRIGLPSYLWWLLVGESRP